MNFQKTDINEPENILHFKRSANPKINYYNKNINVFKNYVVSQS